MKMAQEFQYKNPDPASWTEIKAWRKAQRESLINNRIMLGGKKRRQLNELIEGQLIQQLAVLDRGTIGFYWPFKGEYDARGLVKYLLDQKWNAALPAVVERGEPLEFRLWTPETRLVPGIWKIPVPEERRVVPADVLIIPLVGFDAALFRLGYGGGYYDRTIASLEQKPFLVGVGYDMALLPTIYPQAHDIPMDLIITESGTLARDAAG